MIMTVLKVLPNGTELASINLLDVDCMEIEDRKIVYFINNQKYRHISTLSELGENLTEQGFDMLDKTNLVNLNKITKFDEEQSVVYFNDNDGPRSKYATVARIKQKMIEKGKQSFGIPHVGEILKRMREMRLV